MNNTYDKGIFRITKQTLQISNTTINLSRIENLKVFSYERHSIFSGLKTWIILFIIVIIICAFAKNLDWLANIYAITIIPLIVYNFNEHKKRYFGLKIKVGDEALFLKSDSQEFINNLHDTIVTAMDTRNENYTINFDSHDIINNGIVSKGNNNNNKIIK